MKVETIISKHISSPDVGYAVSFTQKSLFDLTSLELNELVKAYENIPRSHFRSTDWRQEEQRVVRAVAESPEKALAVAEDHCGRIGRDFRVAPLKEAISLFAFDHKFTRDDILSIAKSEGKSVQNFGAAGQQRFGLWEVDGIEGTFISGGGVTRYLSTLSPHQTIVEINRIESDMVEAPLILELDAASQQTLDILLYVDGEARRRREQSPQVFGRDAGLTEKDDLYLQYTEKMGGGFARIRPNQGVIDVEVWKQKPEYDSLCCDLNIRALTIDEVRNSLLKSEMTLLDNYADEFSGWQKDYWQSHAQGFTQKDSRGIQVDGPSRLYANIGLSESGEFKIAICEDNNHGSTLEELNKYLAYGDSDVWRSDELYFMTPEERVDFGATPEGQLLTGAGVRKALGQFGFELKAPAAAKLLGLQQERIREFLEAPLNRIHEDYAYHRYDDIDPEMAVEKAVERASHIVTSIATDQIPSDYRDRFEALQEIVEIGASAHQLGCESSLTKIVGLVHETLGLEMDDDLVEGLQAIERQEIAREDRLMRLADGGEMNSPSFGLEERNDPDDFYAW
jgi:hypothetical protein